MSTTESPSNYDNLEEMPILEILKNLNAAASALGEKVIENPFMTLSFLALPVIPKLKLTDSGLVDVEKFEVTVRQVIRQFVRRRSVRRARIFRGILFSNGGCHKSERPCPVARVR